MFEDFMTSPFGIWMGSGWIDFFFVAAWRVKVWVTSLRSRARYC